MKMNRQLARWTTFIYRIKNQVKQAGQLITSICSAAIPVLLLLCVALAVYDFGFQPFWINNQPLNFWLQALLDILAVLMGLRLLLDLFIPKKKWARIFTFTGWLFILVLAFYVLPAKAHLTRLHSNRFIVLKLVLYAGILLAFITETSHLLQYVYSRTINPALLFVASFAFLILLGALLLRLPNAHNGSISLLDTFFTATSAVCVTGLTVVDTATRYTTFGQVVILVLIQAGGLGIMTFAGLLAYAVAGRTSLKSELALQQMMSTRQISNIMSFIYQVVIVTLFFEAIGAISIYFSLEDQLFDRKLDKLFFSVFHSVSAFCNAGFSTYSGGLYEPVIRFNYLLQFFIALLVILGGMGFPIVFNLFRYLRLKARNKIRMFGGDPRRDHLPKLININSRLALVVTIILLLVGFVAYLVFEQSATLNQHTTWYGKLMTSFFGSVTPRTAGFNTVDLSALSLPTIMIYLLLMWIGASPGSTGGGIRTTTIGVAILNMASVLRNKDRSEFFRSEISNDSIRRAFAIIFLSLLLIGFSIFLISINDSDKGLIRIAFEVFSAFSTVGLTLGITPELSDTSKTVLIFTMFTGRVGMITLLVAFIKQSKQLYYRYPREDIAF